MGFPITLALTRPPPPIHTCTHTHTHTHTHLFAGVYLNLLSGHGKPPQGDTTAMTKHLRSQMRLNVIFLFYSLTTGVTIAYNSHSIKAYASLGYMLGEIVYRAYSICLLRNVKAQYKEDDSFPPASPESRHDTEKECFNSGWTSRLPLINTFSRWICG